MRIRTAVPTFAALVLGLILAQPAGLRAQESGSSSSASASQQAPRVTPPGVSDARLQGYRMSGIGLPWDGEFPSTFGRPLIFPPPIGIPFRAGDSVRLGMPGVQPGSGAADSAGPGQRQRERLRHIPLHRSVVVVSGDGGGTHQVEVIRGGRFAEAPDTADCARVRVRLASGTERTARVALSRLGVETLDEARSALRRQMEAKGVLTLSDLDGTSVSVPARLVRDLSVEGCDTGR